MDKDNEWNQYVKNWENKTADQTCIAEVTRRKEVMRRGLPPNTPIPLAISCPCPKCSPGTLVV